MGSPHPLVGAVSLSAAIAVLIAGCGNGDGGTDPASSSAGAGAVKEVTIEDYLYEPARITVPPGTTVTFVNRDSTPHTATSKQSGVFESDSIDTGRSAKITLKDSGSFAYYCLFHPFMKGTIEVS